MYISYVEKSNPAMDDESGCLRVGDVLVSLAGVDVRWWSGEEVGRLMERARETLTLGVVTLRGKSNSKNKGEETVVGPLASIKDFMRRTFNEERGEREQSRCSSSLSDWSSLAHINPSPEEENKLEDTFVNCQKYEEFIERFSKPNSAETSHIEKWMIQTYKDVSSLEC